jgi:hypothetical protein
MAAIVQFKREGAARSELTPDLREFIDRCVVPALVRAYLEASAKPKIPKNPLADPGSVVAKSRSVHGARTTEVTP